MIKVKESILKMINRELDVDDISDIFNPVLTESGIFASYEEVNKSYSKYSSDDGWSNAIFHYFCFDDEDLVNFYDWLVHIVVNSSDEDWARYQFNANRIVFDDRVDEHAVEALRFTFGHEAQIIDEQFNHNYIVRFFDGRHGYAGFANGHLQVDMFHNVKEMEETGQPYDNIDVAAAYYPKK